MSKRGADEYITKDHGSISNDRDKEDPVKMATAAQLAKRKIAQPRSRMARNGPYIRPGDYKFTKQIPDISATASSGSGTSTPAANPFGSMNNTPQPQQTFGSVNGFTFGAPSQSQSFPPANPSSATGNMFNFSAPGSNNPFAATTNNTFTNPNGNNSFSSTNGNTSSMFGGGFGQQNGDDVSMESPEKKQQTAFNFGGPPQQPPAAPVFSFGGSQESGKSQPGVELFGSQNNQAGASDGALFGKLNKAPEKKEEQSAGGLLGKGSSDFGSTSSQKPLFGAGQQSSTFDFTASSQAETTSKPSTFSFGQTNETSKTPEITASTPFKFGGATTTTQPSTPIIFGNRNAPATAPAKPLFNFGSQTDKPASNLFGAPQSEKPAEPKQVGSIFGQPPSSQPPADKPTTTSTPAFSFGSTSAFGAPQPGENEPARKSPEKPADAPKNVFGGIAPLSQPGKSANTSNNLFGGISKAHESESESESESEKPSEEPKNPFSGLFGAKPPTSSIGTEKPRSSPFSIGTAPTTSVSTSLAPAAASQTSWSLVGSVAKAGPTPSSLFSNVEIPAKAPALHEEDNAPTLDVPNKVSDTLNFTESTSLPDMPCPMGPPAKRFKPNAMKYIPAYLNQVSHERRKELFGHIPKAADSTKQFEFKANPSAPEPSQSTQAPSAQGSSLFSARNAWNPSSAHTTAAPSTEVSKKRLFDNYSSDTITSESTTSTTATNQSTLSSFAAPAAPTPHANPNVANPSPATAGHIAKKPVFNQSAASSVPSHLNSEGYKEFDNQDKLRALNREFRKKIMAVDVATHDIDTLLRVYVAARSSIGADIGLYQRTMAGVKRKTEQSEEPTVPTAYKKARSAGPEAVAAAQPAAGALSDTSDGAPSFQPSALAQSKPTNMFGSTSQSSKPVAPSSVKPAEHNRASQILDGMIPRSPGKTSGQPQSTSEKPRNVFSSIQPLSAKGGSFFGGPNEPAEFSANKSFKPAFGQPDSTTPSKPTLGFQPSTTPAKSPPKSAGFQFSGTVGNGFSAFGQRAETGAKKRRAEYLEDECDSDEDSQAEGKVKFEEREREKKARYETIAKTGFKPNFGSAPASTFKPSPKKNSPFEPNSSGSEKADDEDTSGENEREDRDGNFDPEEDDEEASEEDDEVDEDEDGDIAYQEAEEDIGVTDPSREPSPDHINNEISQNPNTGKSLFDRVSAPLGQSDETLNGSDGTSAIFNSTTKPGWNPAPMFAGIGKSTPEPPSFSPFTPDLSYKPASTFNFSAPTATRSDSTSVLGGAAAKVDPKFEGLFGSRPSTPSQSDRPSNAVSNTPADAADHTWKQGSPIRFGTSTPDKSNEAPKFSFTAASPANKDGTDDTPRPFGSLFGKPAPNSASKPEGSLGFSFGQSSTSPAPGFLSAAPHLGVGSSAASSAISSRQSSPGLTDNESVATDATDTDPPPTDEQAKYNEARAGEEDEELVYEVPTVKGLRLANKKTATSRDPEGSWVTMGQGPLRLLKNKDGKTRLLIRNNTNGNVILNEYLQPKLAWSVQNQPGGKTGAVKGFIAQEGALNQWVIKLKLGKEGDLTEALEKERKAQGS